MQYISRMRLYRLLFVALAVAACLPVPAQIKHTSVPIGDAVQKALAKVSLTGEGAHPFHIRVTVSEPENSQSPYHGAIEEWWLSPDQWRRQVTGPDGLNQLIVVSAGKKTEQDQGDYFPLWLHNFVQALFDPLPDAKAWTASSIAIDQITLPNGQKSDACARAKSTLGTGDRATDAFSNVCFDGEGRIKFVGSPRYSMEFNDYRAFAKKQIAHKLVDHPEPGTELVAAVVLLDEMKSSSPDLFTSLPADDDRFRTLVVSSQQLEKLTADNPPIAWPTVHSGNQQGRLAMYISIDTQGHVREAWPLNSDNAGLEDPARDQVRKWILKPAVDSAGKPVQIDGGLGFSFNTSIKDPVPVLSDEEARALATNIVEPVLPPNTLPSGTRYHICIAVNEQGKFAGGGTCSAITSGTEKAPGGAVLASMDAVKQWHFRPLVRDGKPHYFHAELIFTAP